MPTFKVTMMVTEVTMQEVKIEAKTRDGARRLVEHYVFDNSRCEETDRLSWTVSHVKAFDIDDDTTTGDDHGTP